jgi:hypothetical protein
LLQKYALFAFLSKTSITLLRAILLKQKGVNQMGKKQFISGVVYKCPKCKGQKILRVKGYGRYGECANGCHGSFIKVDESEKPFCDWHPGLAGPASRLSGVDGITWYMGCENEATTKMLYNKKHLDVCQRCADLWASPEKGLPLMQAYKEVEQMWNLKDKPKGAYGAAWREYKALRSGDSSHYVKPKDVKQAVTEAISHCSDPRILELLQCLLKGKCPA